MSQVWGLRWRRGKEEGQATGRSDSVMLMKPAQQAISEALLLGKFKAEVKTNLLIW